MMGKPYHVDPVVVEMANNFWYGYAGHVQLMLEKNLTRACTHAYSYEVQNMHMHPCIHAYARTNTHTHKKIHTHTHKYVRTHTAHTWTYFALINERILAYWRAFMHPSIHRFLPDFVCPRHTSRYVDSSLAKQVLDFRPRPWRETLCDTLQYIQEHGSEMGLPKGVPSMALSKECRRTVQKDERSRL